LGGAHSRVELAAAVQDRIGKGRTNLTQRQEQRLGSRHIECLPILGEQPIFEDPGLLRSDCLSKGIGHGTP
jgi:hypothetical protein